MLKRRNINLAIVSACVILSVFIFFLWKNKPHYMQILPENERMEVLTETLIQKEYEGRLTGSDGNKKTIENLKARFESLGIQTYEQTFKLIVPQIDPNSTFSVVTVEGESGTASDSSEHSYSLYKDYSVTMVHNGGGIDYDGELLIVGSNLFRVEPERIKGKIIVIEAARIQGDWISYIVENGGVGVLCCTDTRPVDVSDGIYHQKLLSVDRTGPSLLIGYISGAMYSDLKKSSVSDGSSKEILGVVKQANMHIPITFPVVTAENLFGVINGKVTDGPILMLSANMDGLGLGPDRTVFEGAVSEVSGISALMEIASMVAGQKEIPDATMVFALWNGQYEDFAGSSYYVENPIFPLDRTTLIHLDSLGIKSLEGTQLQSDSVISNLIKDQLSLYAQDEGLRVEKTGPINSVSNMFSNEGVPSVSVSDAREGSFSKSTQSDTIDMIDSESVGNSVQVVMSFIAHTNYTIPFFDYLTSREKSVILICFGLVIFGLALEWLYRFKSNRKPFGVNIEKIYYYFPVVLFKGLGMLLISNAAILFVLSFLANIRQTTDVMKLNGLWTTNFSLYLTVKKTVFYLRSLFQPELYEKGTVGNIVSVIKESGWMSLKLILGTLWIAIVGGILVSIVQQIRNKRHKNASLGMLIAFSIPDVFVVLTGLLMYTWIYQKYPAIKEMTWLKGYVMPLVTLSVIPLVYVARICTVAMDEELRKPYIMAAKAVGYSRTSIYLSEVLPALVYKIFDSVPTLMALIVSNMLIVEYLFNYNGMGYFLLYLYQREDVMRFVPVALALGVMYVSITFLFKRAGTYVNPMKREVNR